VYCLPCSSEDEVEVLFALRDPRGPCVGTD
jgi:hypothetical protein